MTGCHCKSGRDRRLRVVPRHDHELEQTLLLREHGPRVAQSRCGKRSARVEHLEQGGSTLLIGGQRNPGRFFCAAEKGALQIGDACGQASRHLIRAGYFRKHYALAPRKFALGSQALGSRALDFTAVLIEERHRHTQTGNHRIHSARPLETKARTGFANDQPSLVIHRSLRHGNFRSGADQLRPQRTVLRELFQRRQRSARERPPSAVTRKVSRDGEGLPRDGWRSARARTRIDVCQGDLGGHLVTFDVRADQVGLRAGAFAHPDAQILDESLDGRPVFLGGDQGHLRQGHSVEDARHLAGGVALGCCKFGFSCADAFVGAVNARPPLEQRLERKRDIGRSLRLETCHSAPDRETACLRPCTWLSDSAMFRQSVDCPAQHPLRARRLNDRVLCQRRRENFLKGPWFAERRRRGRCLGDDRGPGRSEERHNRQACPKWKFLHQPDPPSKWGRRRNPFLTLPCRRGVRLDRGRASGGSRRMVDGRESASDDTHQRGTTGIRDND